MPRNLPFDLDLLQVASHGRDPGFILRVYDVRSSVGDTIGSVVRGLPLELITGPRDFTAEAVEVQLDETAGDFINNAVQASSLKVTLVDPYGRFNPVNLLADATGDGRWLRSGNVVRLLVGDDSIDAALWPVVFTGTILGSPSITSARSTGEQSISFSCAGREAAFVNLETTTADFGLNTSFLTMANDIAELTMGLDADEVDFSGFGATTTGHASTQLALQSPMVHLAQVLMVDGFLPIFDGEGRLTQTQGNISGLPDRIYDNLDTLIALDYPGGDISIIDAVQVEGLASTMAEMKQPVQDLAEVQITTGFFAQNEDFDVYFSEDRTAVASDIDIKVLRSVNGALNFAGSEEFTLIPAPAGLGGTIGVQVEVSTGFAAALLISIAVGYVAAAWIPDEVLLGITIPTGRAVQALALATILLLMTQIGRLHVLFRGAPVEYVFPVVIGEAILEPRFNEQQQPTVVVNHLINSQPLADSIALNLLFRQVARANPRSIAMLDDLRLVPNDIVELPDSLLGPRRFLLETINRRYRRGEPPLMRLGAFEITGGLLP